MIITSHKVYRGHIDKSSNDHRIRLGSCHISHPMEYQRFRLLDNAPHFFFGKLFHFLLFQIRIQFIQIQTDKDLLYQFDRHSRNQIQIKIGKEIKSCDLQGYGNCFCDRNHICFNVVFLLSICQAILISHKITAYRIK